MKGAFRAASHTQMSLRIHPAPGLCLAPLCPWTCCWLFWTLCSSRPMCGQQVWAPVGFATGAGQPAQPPGPCSDRLRLGLRHIPRKWPCHAGKSPFDHLISQHVSQGWNLRRLGQQDTPSLPFGPVWSECSRSCLRTASSHFCLCQLPSSLWSYPPAPPTSELTLRASHPCVHGAGAPGTQTEWMGCPWHGVGSHEMSSQENLTLLFLSPKNVP